jgi:homoserine/homoserine lactone efflux protein
MTFDAWVLFCATEIVICLSPGPAVLLVVSTSLAKGAGAGVAASVGILIANVVYFVASASSLGVLLAQSTALFEVITWLGAGYLVWLGGSMLVAPSPVPIAGSAPRPSMRRAVGRGFVTQVANPKALVYFTALLPQFIDPTRSVTHQVLVLGVTSLVIETAVLLLYVVASHAARTWVAAPRFAAGLQRAAGLLLIGAAARLAAIRHAV